MSQRTNRTAAFLALVLAGPALALVGCSGKYDAERDGKALGSAMCDLSEATDAQEAEAALSDVESELDAVLGDYASATAEDRSDIENQISELYEHAQSGDTTLVKQDLASIDRNAEAVAGTSNDVGQAAWDGLRQGLSDCIG